MKITELTKMWFDKWETGDFKNIPISENLTHISPYGTIKGKEAYMALIEANRDKFLGHHFVIHDEIFAENKSCIRYTAIQGKFRLEVSEWHYAKNGLLEKIVAHYNIEGEISQDRKLKNPN